MASNQPEASHDFPAEAAVDDEVLAGCRAGAQDAQQRLYELCHRKVYRLLVRLVGVQEAPDVMQQVFLQVFRKVHQFEGNSRFETWLYRLTVNEALQHLRKRKRRRFQPLSQEPVLTDVRDTDRSEQRELLELALARVEPELRTVFLLREVEKLSYREIAETIGIPEGTVGSRLNRARNELQQHLIDLGWQSP